MRELTGEDGEETKCTASGVNERDQRTIPPAKKISSLELLVHESVIY
jgi:hypothetical protein